MVLPVAVRGHDVVGAKLRPDRALTVGKRRSDRWLAYALVMALVLMSLVAAFGAMRSYYLSQDVQDIKTTVERCLP